MEVFNENEMAMVPTVVANDVEEYNYDDIIAVAERAEKMITALNKIMAAAIRITTHYDWILIAGRPYLQETGATKVARLFGISWKHCPGYPQKELDEGYPVYTYRMVFKMGNTQIEAEGVRSGKDEFFAGKADNRKSPDYIDDGDVRKAAYTNCLNNGIKRLLPGLRGLDVDTLEANGINVKLIRGYTFDEGKHGGKGTSAAASGLKCAKCEAAITQREASYSEGKYGQRLCRACQKKVNEAPAPAPQGPDDDVPPPMEAPPERGVKR